MAQRQKRNIPVNFWEMIRDVLIASFNKGQFPAVVVALILLACVLKMPPADVSKFAFEVLKELKEYHLVGDFLSVALIFAWFLHAKFQRRYHLNEIKRISEERNRLQSDKAGVKVQSSNRKDRE